MHNKLTFINYDLLVDVSSYVCSLCILRNIFCYKKLNLKNAKLYQCCHFCAFKCIEEICNIKRLFYRDALISENYRKIKIHFNPEYLNVRDRNTNINIVSSGLNDYYLIQLINLDNQKLQTLKIRIR